MNRSDQQQVVNYLAQTIGQVSLALECAAKGDLRGIEDNIKSSYFGLDNAIHIARGRPEGDLEDEEAPLGCYISPIPVHLAPLGVDTILGWMAKNNPDRLREMQNPVEDSKRDGYALMAKARRDGYTPCKVEACRALKDHGITEVNAYPNDWLRDRLG